MEIDLLQFKRSCIENWRGAHNTDVKLKNFDNLFQEWFEQIPDESKEIVLTLIKHLKYYSRETVNEWLYKLHFKLLSHANVTDENTIYAFIKSADGKSNSSNDYWTEYKMINSINLEICYENIDAIAPEQWHFIDNIVFIDDFCGSGGSLKAELKKDLDRYRNKNVYFVIISIMNHGQNEIAQFASDNNINIIPIFAEIQEKAFESNLFLDNDSAKQNISDMSKKLSIYGEPMGFRDSQSLIAFYNNTPNNTLKFIWYDNKKYKSIFPRKHDEKPSWQTIKKQTNQRKKANYNNKTGVNIDYE